MARKKVVREGAGVAVATYRAWRQDRTIRLGAGLAYYMLFTIVPLLALTAALAEWLFGTDEVQNYINERLTQIGVEQGEAGAQAISDEISDAETRSSLGVVGLASLVFASSLVFMALSDAINVIWDVPVRSGIWSTVKRRLVAFLMVLAAGAVIIATFAVAAVSGAAAALLPDSIALVEEVTGLLTAAASGLALAFALACLYRFLGPVRVTWLVAGIAGVSSAFLMWLGTQIVGWYMHEYGGASLPGAFGAVLAMLVWLYYQAQIVLVGAQATKVLTIRAGDFEVPPEHDPQVVAA